MLTFLRKLFRQKENPQDFEIIQLLGKSYFVGACRKCGRPVIAPQRYTHSPFLACDWLQNYCYCIWCKAKQTKL